MDTRHWDKQRICYNQPTPDDFLPHMNTVKFLRPDHGETKSFKMWRASKDHSKYWIPAKTVRKVNKHWERHNGSSERATIVCRCFFPDPLHPKLRSVMMCMVLIELHLIQSITSIRQSNFGYYEYIRSILSMDNWLMLVCFTSLQLWCPSDIWLPSKHFPMTGLAKIIRKVIYILTTKPLEQEKIVLVEIEAASYLLCPPYGKSYPTKINIMNGSFSITFHAGIFKHKDICLNKLDKNLESDEVSSFTSPMVQIKYDSTLEKSSQPNLYKMVC